MMNDLLIRVDALIENQLATWPLAERNYIGLDSVLEKTIAFNGFSIVVQYNAERYRSSAAKVDTASISARPCFLCPENRPTQQSYILWYHNYHLLINPFPIFNQHLTIPTINHQPQLISGKMDEMLSLAKELERFTIFYNGPQCGASAPDHFHFQAIQKGVLPIERDFLNVNLCHIFIEKQGVIIYHWHNYLRGVVTLVGSNYEQLIKCFDGLLHELNCQYPNEVEPMLNIVTYYLQDKWVIHIFPRLKHRPVQFYTDNGQQLLISPASVDMGGVWVTSRLTDFEALNADLVEDIFSQVCLSSEEVERVLGCFKSR